MGAPDDMGIKLDATRLRAAVESGEHIEKAARRLWRFAPSCHVWPTMGVLWDRSPWWYLREWCDRHEAAAALRWVRRGGPGERTEAGWQLVERVAAAEAAYKAEYKRASGG